MSRFSDLYNKKEVKEEVFKPAPSVKVAEVSAPEPVVVSEIAAPETVVEETELFAPEEEV